MMHVDRFMHWNFCNLLEETRERETRSEGNEGLLNDFILVYMTDQ
jgi:hypothetical protein